ncbi:rhomboid-like protein [Streptomyces dysideae]|uniref:rhomboid-like protein n=1 Tax=Streptomyces dysideae TaxID=909626 RepID=UPI00389A1E51
MPGQRRAGAAAPAALAVGDVAAGLLAAPSATDAPAPRTRRFRPWRLLPTPTGTPFTFGYATVLAGTSLVVACADPALVHALHQGSSTDVVHLVRTPGLVSVASALWVAGGNVSPYAVCFLLVLTALERRIGGLRAAGVFLLGHLPATLATEVPVGFAVLAGLLTPWLRRSVLVLFGGMLVQDLVDFADPMTSWGRLISLAIGIATWPLTRRRYRARTAP